MDSIHINFSSITSGSVGTKTVDVTVNSVLLGSFTIPSGAQVWEWHMVLRANSALDVLYGRGLHLIRIDPYLVAPAVGSLSLTDTAYDIDLTLPVAAAGEGVRIDVYQGKVQQQVALHDKGSLVP